MRNPECGAATATEPQLHATTAVSVSTPGWEDPRGLDGDGDQDGGLDGGAQGGEAEGLLQAGVGKRAEK